MAEENNGSSQITKPEDKRVLLDVQSLVKYFPVRGGILQRVQGWVKAVDDVSFHIYEGETLGLVGESGCGKTTVGRTVLRLIPATSGNVIFNNEDIFGMNASDLKRIRREMQIIFQDPYSSLDPRMPVGESIAEGLRIHTDKKGQERYDVVVEMLSRVGMRADHARRYPHEFSGGQRQRIGEQVGGGRVVALDHDARYAEETQGLLRRYGVEQWAEVVHTPLVEHEVDENTYRWYRMDDVDLPAEIELLFVDGPPEAVGPLSRYPAFPLIRESLADHATIILDDGRREAEQEIAARWSDDADVVASVAMPFERAPIKLDFRRAASANDEI